MSIEKIIDDFSLINDQIVKYLDVRLREWAVWNLKKEDANLDYPAESVEYQIMTLGILPREKYKAPKLMPVHERAEEMEAIISVMAKQGEQAGYYAVALREYYLGKGRGDQKR